MARSRLLYSLPYSHRHDAPEEAAPSPRSLQGDADADDVADAHHGLPRQRPYSTFLYAPSSSIAFHRRNVRRYRPQSAFLEKR